MVLVPLGHEQSAQGTERSGEEGSVYVEYIILVGLFGLVIVGAVLALGGPLLKFYHHAQLVWAGPFP